MITINDQAEEARKVRRLADRVAYLARKIEAASLTNEQRYAMWAEIRADSTVMLKRAEHARDGD